MGDDPSDNPMDQVLIGGYLLPGLADIWKSSKPSRKRKWDKKSGAGAVGETMTYRGEQTVEWVIDLTFWDETHVDAWDALYPQWTDDGKTAYDVTHPTLDRLRVKSIVIVEIVQLFPVLDKTAWAVQLGVNEYKPPAKKNVTTTPDGSKSNSGKTEKDKPPTAKSAQEIEIQQLLEEAKKP
jgi:hypothetical protein